MSWLTAYAIFEWAVRLVMVVVILGRRLSPVTALAWLSIVFFWPVVGLPLYLLFGVNYVGRRRRAAHRRFYAGSLRTQRSQQRRERLRSHKTAPALDPASRNMLVQAEQVSGNPIVGGNHMRLLPDTDGFVKMLCEDIVTAERHVHLLYYIYWPDKVGTAVTEALVRTAKRGVKCRLLLDAAGSRTLYRSGLYRDLVNAGVDIRWMLPVNPLRRRLARLDLRNHRKVAVIDGRVGYTGSHNIVDEGYNFRNLKFVDLSARFTGPVVAQLQMVFLDDWDFNTGDHIDDDSLFPPLEPTGNIAAQVVPTGPNHEAETFRRVMVAALNAANKRIVITTPYLVPDEPTMLALSMAADRGVDVTLLVPKRGDHPIVAAAGRWYFDALLENGVKIHHYCEGMLHAKTITVDHSFALLGSANMDVRSFELNFECSVLLYGEDVTDLLRFAQQQYLKQCETIELKEWRKRPFYKRYLDSAAGLLSPLL